MTTTTTEIAWAAGLFEGEGCFTIQRTPRRYAGGGEYMYPVARLHMTDRDIVERFHNIVGFGRFWTNNKPRGGLGKKVAFTWYTNKSDEFLALLEMFRPFLGVRRLARAEEVLSMIAANREVHSIGRA